MTSLPWFLAVLVGAGMGFCSGLFGLGGSSIGTPILRLFGLPALIALASPLPLTLPSAIGGAIAVADGKPFAYQKDRLIHWRIAVLTSLWGCPGVLAGAWLTAFIPATTLMLLTALFILGVGAYGLSEFRSRAVPEPMAQLNRRIIPYYSPPMGLINGLLANGGGLLLVPFYQLGIGLELRAALATSLATVALMGLPSTIVHTALGHIDWVLTGWLAIGVFPFTYLGSQLALHLPTLILTRLYSLFLIALALYFGYVEIAVLL